MSKPPPSGKQGPRSKRGHPPPGPVAPQIWTQASLEDEVHRSLGRLVLEAARFDFFVGLQLNSLGPYCRVDVSKHLHPTRCTLDERLVMLQKLVKRAFSTAGPEVAQEFNDWFASARAAKALRNRYAHGQWGIPGRWAESPLGLDHPRVPMLAFVPLGWDLTPDLPDRSVYLTVEELGKQVDEAIGVFQAFFALTQKHLAHCLPAQPPTET